jgi:hypothetical protein
VRRKSGGHTKIGLGVAVVAALAVTAILVPGASARSSKSAANVPTLYVNYTNTCTFSFSNDAGQTVTSIPAGTYEVEVQTPIMFKLITNPNMAVGDMTGCGGWVQFQMTGPGVSLFTTLDTGCVSADLLPETTFKAGATYNAVDLNQPSVAHLALTVTTGTPVAGPSPYDNGTGKGETQQQLIGSSTKTTKLSGTLIGSLASNGALKLMLKGKPVSSLKAGRYRFTITDKSPSAAFTILPSGGQAKAITGTAFVGRHTEYLTLTAGSYAYSTGSGKSYSFQVAG